MKCNKTTPCPNCPFLKNTITPSDSLDVKRLSKQAHSEKGVPCKDSVDVIERCAGAVIHASLSNKTFKDKKLRFYQSRLGKSSDVFNKEEFLSLILKKI